MQRTSASGGLTIHLAPGQRRGWTFSVPSPGADYRVMVRYANDETGDGETLTIAIDGLAIGVLRAQDTGDDGAGWNVFVSDRAGGVRLAPGAHLIAVESSGGDGCIEVDAVSLVPTENGGG